ncbi:heavy-metal-associated domain-containing protein [Spirillospora sp. NPDC127200]
MSERTYAVAGMACGHCAEAVAEEVRAVDGVSAVAVDLREGLVTVTGDRPLDDAAVRAAIEEAGYDLAR